MRSRLKHLLVCLTALSASVSGTTAVIFGVSAPVVLGVGGLAIDYANYTGQLTSLQSVADQAALSAANELKLSSSTPALVQQLAIDYANVGLSGSPGVSSGATITA